MSAATSRPGARSSQGSQRSQPRASGYSELAACTGSPVMSRSPAAAPTKPRLEHHFGRMRVSHPEDDRALLPMGGSDELSSALSPEVLPGNVLASPGANPTVSGGATLTYFTQRPKTDLGCGGFEWIVGWGLSGANDQTNGFVVQEIRYSLERYRCADQSNVTLSGTYWEAWRVSGGSVVGRSGLFGTDTFRVRPTPGHYGLTFQEGYAKYLDGYTEPLRWGSLPEAGSGTWATRSRPSKWSVDGAIHRWLQSDFSCCYGAREATFSTGED